MLETSQITRTGEKLECSNFFTKSNDKVFLDWKICWMWFISSWGGILIDVGLGAKVDGFPFANISIVGKLWQFKQMLWIFTFIQEYFMNMFILFLIYLKTFPSSNRIVRSLIIVFLKIKTYFGKNCLDVNIYLYKVLRFYEVYKKTLPCWNYIITSIPCGHLQYAMKYYHGIHIYVCREIEMLQC